MQGQLGLTFKNTADWWMCTIYILQYPTFKGKSISALLLGFSRFFSELQAASLNIALPHARTYFEGVFFSEGIDPY
jgi:hypothetical protein